MVAGGVGLSTWRLDRDLVLVRLVVTVLLKLETTGETGTLLSMDPCCTEVVVGSDVVVGDGTGKGRLVVVFITPAVVSVLGGGEGGEGRGELSFIYNPLMSRLIN